MRSLINAAFAYAVAAMAGGVFYREFTRFNGFEGRTALAVVHTHLFLLGMFFFLIAAILERLIALSNHQKFGLFFLLYNAGVSLTAVMLTVRGVAQVLSVALSPAADAAVSGVAGIGHILTGAGLILFFVVARARSAERSERIRL